MRKPTAKRGPGRPEKAIKLVTLSIRVTREQADTLAKLKPRASHFVRKALQNAGLGKAE